jgi:four helix bundle protein
MNSIRANMNAEELKKRTQDFALAVIKLVQTLPNYGPEKTISYQLLKCGTSVGANYRAACLAKSNSDFIAKMKIVEEECDESVYWIELLLDLPRKNLSMLEPLKKEATEILKIAVASIRTTRSRNTPTSSINSR